MPITKLAIIFIISKRRGIEMLNNATNIISLKKLQQSSVKVKEVWCTEQEEDFKRMICMVDDLVSHAVSIGNSPHAYQQLESAKRNFLEEFLDMAEKYRLIDCTYK